MRAVTGRDKFAALRTLSPAATITFGDDDSVDVAGLIERLDGAGWTKMIGAGSTVVASVTSEHGRGVMFAELAWRRSEIRRIRYFPRAAG